MQEHNIPTHIECSLSYNGEPVAGLMLLGEFATTRKNSYEIVFGPSDEHGRAVVTQDEIIAQADIQLELALMDFDKLEDVYAGTFSIKVMNSIDIKYAISAYNIYKSFAHFPEKYLDNMNNALLVVGKIHVSSIDMNYIVYK